MMNRLLARRRRRNRSDARVADAGGSGGDVAATGVATAAAPAARKPDALAARPLRVRNATESRVAEGTWRVTVPVRPSRWAAFVLRVPASATRTFELDELGKLVWDACDGRTDVAAIIRRLADAYGLNPREAEVATLAFLRTLAAKGLVGVAADGHDQKGESAEHSTANIERQAAEAVRAG